MKRKLPTPITILFFVIIIAAIATWLIPAGKYSTLAYAEGSTTFEYKAAETSVALPFTQTTLDSLNIRIPIENFSSGAIRKPVSVPDTYQPLSSERQGWLEVLQAPIKGVMDSIDIIFFILVIGGFMLCEFGYRRRRFPRQDLGLAGFLRGLAGLGPAFWREALR